MKKKALMISSLLLASSILVVGCEKEDKEKSITTNNVTTLHVLSQAELAKAKQQQEDRGVLVENIANSILTVTNHFLPVESLNVGADEEGLYVYSVFENDFEKDLKLALLDSEIEGLNNLTANHLTERELKLVEQLTVVKQYEKELYGFLYKAWNKDENKYIFTEEDKKAYELKRKTLLSVFIDNEKDILASTSLYLYPEIPAEDLDAHLEFQAIYHGLINADTIDYENTLDNILSTVGFDLLTLEDTDPTKKDAIKASLTKIKEKQNEYLQDKMYKSNKFYKSYADNLVKLNVDELMKSVDKGNYIEVYKAIQSGYVDMSYSYSEGEYYSYMLILEFYLGTLKTANETVELNKAEEVKAKAKAEAEANITENENVQNEDVDVVEVQIEDKATNK